jgi:hypothetical protein
MFFGGIEIRITNKNMIETLLEIQSFATNHHVTGMQLVVICNYLGVVCNYKFGIV